MKRDLYKKYFENKKITVMGLGLLGRGIQVSRFLAESGANLTITDLKSENDLKNSVKKLKDFKIKYILGEHRLEDFENRDMIIKSAGVPLDSPFIEKAREKNIPIEMDASLFTKIVREIYHKVKIIGITGTRGKSMTTALIFHILKENKNKLGSNVFLGGNMRNSSTLPIIKKIKPKDIVVLELDSWQCQGFGDNKISPDISVFTSFMKDHLNYYKNDINTYLKDKSFIYKFQKKDDILITNKKTINILNPKPKSKVFILKKETLLKISKLNLKIFGKHNIQNASYAFEVAKNFGLSEKDIFKSLKSFNGLDGRCQFFKIKNKNIVNDNNATTPEATSVAIKSCREKFPKSKIVLIAGGSDKNLDLSPMIREFKNISSLILLSGKGTDKLIKKIKIKYTITHNLKTAIKLSLEKLSKNDVLLFSPGFASFGMFKNEYDRNDQFLKLIKKYDITFNIK